SRSNRGDRPRPHRRRLDRELALRSYLERDPVPRPPRAAPVSVRARAGAREAFPGSRRSALTPVRGEDRHVPVRESQGTHVADLGTHGPREGRAGRGVNAAAGLNAAALDGIVEPRWRVVAPKANALTRPSKIEELAVGFHWRQHGEPCALLVRELVADLASGHE